MEDQQVQTISSELMLLFEVVDLTIVSLLDTNIESLILHFHELYLLSLLHLM